MKKKTKGMLISDYNEFTEDELLYYIHESSQIGDIAYLYAKEDDEWTEMEIIHIIRRKDNPEYYDHLPEDFLLQGESEYNADSSAEFIGEDDCYLVWFKHH